MEFKQDDEVSFFDNKGQEFEGVVLACLQNNQYRVRYFHDYILHTDIIILGERLLPRKGPFIRNNGEVLTDDPSHANQLGRIIATGKTLNDKKQFFRVKFAEDDEAWFSEDRVFVDDAVLKEWNNANKKGA